MSTLDETTFGKLQEDERYKRLERALKLHAKKFANNDTQSGGWPNLSSIVDPSEYGAPSTVSKGGSEIISASKTIREMLLRQKKNSNHMATSSVKQSPVKNDCFKMPLPVSLGALSCKSKSIVNGSTNASSPLQLENNDVSLDNSIAGNHNGISNEPKVNYRIFRNWKVVLKQGHLVIKGTLEGGTVARSKPVAKRISENRVESVNHHEYRLVGNLQDENRELPEYVRNKFLNGFPDDWKNVHQVWMNFIFQGSRLSFHWPTRVTDSDDDLRSEINVDSVPRRSTRLQSTLSLLYQPSSSGYVTDNSRRQLENCHTTVNTTVKDVTPDILLGKQKSIIRSDEAKQNLPSEKGQTRLDKSDDFNPIAEARGLVEPFLKKEILEIIMTNLQDGRCPDDYIENFCLTVTYLAHLTSFKVDKSERQLTESEQQTGPKQVSRVEVNKSQFIDDKEVSSQLDDESISDNSESDVYAGVRKISVEKLLTSKRRLPKYERNARRRTRSQDSVKSRKEQKSLSSVNLTGNEASKSPPQKKLQSFNDISITEEEPEEVRPKPSAAEQKRSVPSEVKPRQSSDDLNKSICSNYQLKIPEIRLQKMKNIKEAINKSNESLKETQLENSQPVKKLDKTAKKVPTILSSVTTNFKVSEILKPKPTAAHNTSDLSIIDTEEPVPSGKEKEPAGRLLPANSTKKPSQSQAPTAKQTQPTQDKATKMLAKAINKPDMDTAKKTTESTAVLTSWTPQVVFDEETLEDKLVFHGRLLNDAGVIVSRKFTTDFVSRRLKPKLIETENHKLYELRGDVNNTNHVLPMELVNECRVGCPAKIYQFCKAWKKLKERDASESNKLNETVDNLELRVSTRGRKIMPPLNFWTGERIAVLGNTPTYNPGNELNSSQLMSENSMKNKSQENEGASHGKSATEPKKNKSQETELVRKKFAESNDVTKRKSTVASKSPVKSNKRARKTLTYTSSSSESEPVRVKKRSTFKANSKAVKQATYKEESTRLLNSSVNLRRRNKVNYKEYDEELPKKRMIGTLQELYYENAPREESDLSDDQKSFRA